MFYIEMISILFLHYKYIEVVQLPHVVYAKNIQDTDLEKTVQILLPRNAYGTTFSARFPYCFNAFFVWKQHEPFYQHNLCKKAQTLVSYQV
jgi:hypothetical protein